MSRFPSSASIHIFLIRLVSILYFHLYIRLRYRAANRHRVSLSIARHDGMPPSSRGHGRRRCLSAGQAAHYGDKFLLTATHISGSPQRCEIECRFHAASSARFLALGAPPDDFGVPLHITSLEGSFDAADVLRAAQGRRRSYRSARLFHALRESGILIFDVRFTAASANIPPFTAVAIGHSGHCRRHFVSMMRVLLQLV